MLSPLQMYRWCGLAWLLTTCPPIAGEGSTHEGNGIVRNTIITTVRRGTKSAAFRSRPWTSGGSSRSLTSAGDCPRLEGSIFVDSKIEHIGGCYALDTGEGVESNAPLFVKDGSTVGTGSSILFFSYHVEDPLSAKTSPEPEGRFAWSIWYLTDVEGDSAGTNFTTCSSFAVNDIALGYDEPVHPADPRLRKTWTCSSLENDQYIMGLPADFDAILHKRKLLPRELTAEVQGGQSDDDNDESEDDGDESDDDSDESDDDSDESDDDSDESDDDNDESDDDNDSDDDDEVNNHGKDDSDDSGDGDGGGVSFGTAEIFLLVIVVGAILMLTGWLFWQGRRPPPPG